MRKHNKQFAIRFGRTGGDRTNFPQTMAHSIVNNKALQLGWNDTLTNLLRRVR